MDGLVIEARPRRQRTQKAALLKEVPLASGCMGDGSLPPEIEAMVRQASQRIDTWTPKGVHFGWEQAFRNKGKFPVSMSKPEARALVQRVLCEARLQVFANRREGIFANGEFRIVADAGEVIGTRGQRVLRIVLVRDSGGYRVDNAFPVLSA